MEWLKRLILALVVIFTVIGAAHGASEQIRITLNEFVNQTVEFEPLLGSGSGTWFDAEENQTNYEVWGRLTVSNSNGAETMSDIYVTLTNTQNITLPTAYSGRSGTWRSSTPSSGSLVLHIPELRAGENSVWEYTINGSAIRPPLNFTSNYSDYKILAGENITITDYVQNSFYNHSFQGDTCIRGINITQSALQVNFSGTFYNFEFSNGTIAGGDAVNASINTATNRTLNWDVFGGECLPWFAHTNISYNVSTPSNIPSSQPYQMINTTLAYTLNETISHVLVDEIRAISEANISLQKQILAPSHPTLFGSNVTWNVTGYFTAGTDITYNLSYATLWVSQRNVNGSFTDPNSVDNDSINTSSVLNISYTPNVLVNSSQSWASAGWLFNYSDLPTPIAWIDVNFSIVNDGTQLINRSVTQNGSDYYIKELYLIIGYWLEVEKNVTSVGPDTYQVDIDVHNRGNQVTPSGTVVTVYDFVPSNFSFNGSMVYSDSGTLWYTTTASNDSTINGPDYYGTLMQWAIIANNTLNVSLDQGPAKNENTTWSVTYNVTGSGDYQVLDVFITGLDPQKVDGAGSSPGVVVEELIDKLKSTEGVFALVAMILLLLGLVV